MLAKVAVSLTGTACVLAVLASIAALDDAGLEVVALPYALSGALALAGLVAYAYHVVFEWGDGEDGPGRGGGGPDDGPPDLPDPTGPVAEVTRRELALAG